MSWVASLRSRTASDDPSAIIAIGLGSSYSKRTLPGFWDVEIALGLAAVGSDLDEISDQRLQRGQIGNSLWPLAPFWLASKGRKNIDGEIAARIGDHRVRAAAPPAVAPVVIGPPLRVRRNSAGGRSRAFWGRALESERSVLERLVQETGCALPDCRDG